MTRFNYAVPSPSLARRHLVAKPVGEFHAAALQHAGPQSAFTVDLGAELLFDGPGLALIQTALAAYQGNAQQLAVHLVIDDVTRREFYGLQDPARMTADSVILPVVARRQGGQGEDILRIPLPVTHFPMPFPTGLAQATTISVPKALLLPSNGPFDILFANQIALVVEIEQRARHSASAILRGMAMRAAGRTIAQRVGLAYRDVHPDADVHPTAVVEGSIVEAGARIGAHASVRFSWIGKDARLHDGAKVEYSVVGERTWLMHDLVLYRSVAEAEVFLIHGPYQFSFFQSGSGAFATILMDYRPDGKAIRAETSTGLLPYGGRLLGSVLCEGARTLGGSLLAPGRVVPKDVWLSAVPDQIHAVTASDLPPGLPLAPQRTRA